MLEQNILRGPIDQNHKIDNDDLIVDIEKQIEYLKSKNLTIKSEKNLISMIENYGFNHLFRCYSWPFIEKDSNGSNQFKYNTSEESILTIFNFDNKLKNIIENYLDIFEHKFQSNIIATINFIYPNVKEQFNSLWNQFEQKKYVKKVEEALQEGSYYLMPFVTERVFPAWIILDMLTIGEKCFLLKRLHNDPSKFEKMLSHFYLDNQFTIDDLNSIVFDFIRPFRNVIAHGDRLMRFKINLQSYKKEIFDNLMQKITAKMPELQQKQILERNNNEINSFALIIMLLFLIEKSRAKTFVESLKTMIEDDNYYFDTNEILTNKNIYNWPHEWPKIFDYIVSEKD